MTPRARLLLLEDEPNVGSTLRERFEDDGFEVCWTQSCEGAMSEIAVRRFDLALLDLGLPDGSGFEVAQRLRTQAPGTAIVFLTAQGSPEYRVRGLELGAEDYIVKPFHLKELKLRVQNGLKRAQYLASAWAEVQDGVRIGKAEISWSKFEARTRDRGAEEVHSLTHRELAVLRFLLERRGKVVSRDEILNHVWSDDEYPTPRTIDNFILRLRKLVETNSDAPEIIRSVRGVGYQLV